MPGEETTPETSEDGSMPGEGAPPGEESAEGTPESSDMPPENTPTSDDSAPADSIPNEGIPNEGIPDEGVPGDGTELGMIPPKPKSLRERSMDMFRAGRDDQAFALLMTHYFVSPESGPELKQRMKWVAGLRRPALATRFGIVVVYSPPPNFEGELMPIGSPELQAALSEANANNNDGGNEDRPRRRRAQPKEEEAVEEQPAYDPATVGEGPMGELVKYTGEVGIKLVEALKGKIKAGTFGETLKEAATVVPPVTGENGETLDGQPTDDSTGDGTEGLPGEGLPGGVPLPEGAEALLAKQLAPGISWLGVVENSKELEESPKVAAVDVVIVFEVAVRSSRNSSLVSNSTKFRVATVKKDKDEPIFTSNALVNIKIANERKTSSKKEDEVDKEIARGMEATEKTFAMQPLPAALTADVVKRRLATLSAEKPANPLPVLLEARLYAAQGLITEEEVMSTAMATMGETQFVQLLNQMPAGGVGQMLGQMFSPATLGSLVKGVNDLKQPPAAAAPPAAKGGGLRKLLPF